MKARAAIVALLFLSHFSVATPESAVHLVSIQGMAFNPPRVVAQAGDTIIWENRDLVPHNVVSKDSQLKSGVIGPGGRWSWTIREARTVNYICTFHPGMSAILEVRRGGQ